MQRQPLTSFAAAPCEPCRDCSRPSPHHRGLPDPPPQPPRQRQTASPDQDAFHRRVLPPPFICDACALLTHAFAWNGITRRLSPAGPRPCLRRTGFAARVLVAFATAIRLPAPFHPSGLPEGSRRARPSHPGGWRTKRRSSTSAIQTIREHHQRIDRSPRHRASPSTRFRALPASRAFAREERSLHPAPGLRPEPGFFSVRHPKAPLESRSPSRGRGSSLTNEGFAPNSAAGGCRRADSATPRGRPRCRRGARS